MLVQVVSSEIKIRCREKELPVSFVGEYYPPDEDEAQEKFMLMSGDALTGKEYWLSAMMGIRYEDSITVVEVELPLEDEFVIDKIAYWQDHSQFEDKQIFECFQRSRVYFQEAGFCRPEVDLFDSELGPDYGFCYSDFNEFGLQRLRANYRDWIWNSLASDTISSFEIWE